jgi:hypothetical protein
VHFTVRLYWYQSAFGDFIPIKQVLANDWQPMNCVSLKQNIVLRNIKEKISFYQELAKLDFVTLVMILLMTSPLAQEQIRVI